MTNTKQAIIGLPLITVMREEVVSKILEVPLDARLAAVVAERALKDEVYDNNHKATTQTKQPA